MAAMKEINRRQFEISQALRRRLPNRPQFHPSDRARMPMHRGYQPVSAKDIAGRFLLRACPADSMSKSSLREFESPRQWVDRRIELDLFRYFDSQVWAFAYSGNLARRLNYIILRR